MYIGWQIYYSQSRVKELEAKQRRLELEVRQAKREVNGLTNLHAVQEAKRRLRVRQSALRQFVDENSDVLRRDYWRERDDTAKNVQSMKNTVAKQRNDATITEGKDVREEVEVHHITQLDVEKYKCVTGDITTRDVVITDERIQHIVDHHPNDFERYESYMAQIIEKPDYILQSDMPNTAFVLKEIMEADEKFQLILRLKVSTDPEHYKNSVITFLKISEKKWNKYLRNKKILYKSE